ncbi:MAG TPA: methionine synthase, partial [Acidimicrobiia bacterium]
MGRILTTHAGSLPRPKELDALWARNWRGEAVDHDEIDALVEAATAAIIARQVEVGLDIVGNGEQGRESFFTHVRDRFSGFGGKGDVRPFRDVRAFPQYLQARVAMYTDPNSVSLVQVPAAVDEVRYLGTGAIERELA